MEPSCIRQDLIPGTTKLFADFLYHFERVSDFYQHPYSNPQSFQDAAKQVQYPEDRRARLVEALREQNGTSASLDELARPGTLAVVTGQQVGLLSGPSYTIYKALTAVRLVHELRAAGVRAVPVFWLASEDHDLAEVDHAWLFDQNARPAKISVTNAVANGGPVGEVAIPELPWTEIAQALGDLPFASEVLDRLRNAYTPGATFTCGFKRFLQDTLKDFGLLFLDPLAPAIRSLAAPFLASTVERVPELLEALRRRDAELAERGYHAQVHLDQNSSLLFLLSDGKRVALRSKEGRFSAREKEYTAQELACTGEHLSPNALLRPVMQDYLLPTISYIGGPSEIAYMAQAQVLYKNLLGRMPVMFPRNSFTLLDSRAEKLMARYRLSLPDLFTHPDKVRSAIAAQLVPAGLAGEFSVLESSLTKSLESLRHNLHSFDPTLEAAAQKSSAKMLYQLKRLASKTARETLRRDERSVWAANYLVDLVYPQKHLQERFYSIVPFLAKHGPDLPQHLFERTQLTCPDHMVRTI
jgi:bacillithiol biosynthesis cysteine-adding enzyme BshC